MSRFLIVLFLSLTLVLLAPVANAQDSWQTASNIHYGETIQATMSLSAGGLQYVFEANSGDTVSIIASAKDPQSLSLEHSLFDPSGHEIATSQYYSDIGAAILEMRLEQGGQHRIVIQAMQGEGNFEITLQGRSVSEYQTIFYEDFDENNASWETASGLILPGGAIQTSELRDGSYNIAGTWTTTIWSWIVAPGLNNWAVAPILVPPYEMEVEFSNVQSSTGNYLIGLAFYVQENYAGYYQITIQSHDGVADSLNFQRSSNQSDWKEFEAVPLDKNPHRLRIVVKNDKEYIVWLDDHFIYRLTYDSNTEWENGSVGLVLGASRDDKEAVISASFDNLIVRVPTQPPTATCIVEATVVANIRAKPDLNSPVQRRLAVGMLETAVGQATGTDGFLWWKLQDGNWVHSAVVIAESACEKMPLVVP